MARLLPALLAAAALSACGGGLPQQMENQKDPETSLIVGHIDMKDGPCWLHWFSMKQVMPKVEKPYFNFRIDEGTFYAEYIPLGSFQLSDFGGDGSWPSNTRYTFRFPQQLQGLRLEKPGIYYLGSFKMTDEGNFFKSKYDIELAKTPSERDVLEKILPHAKGTDWEERLRLRLEELK